jgi:hypothetical protein
MPVPVHRQLARCAAVGILAACCIGAAQAATLSLVDASSRSVVETLNFYSNAAGNTVTQAEAEVYVGSYQLSNGVWANCLSPLTNSNLNTPYSFNPVTLSSFITSPTGYAAVFGGYGNVGPGYMAQDAVGVLSKITELYNYAYADSQTSAAKSAAFAFALWEIEGETVAPYSTSTGGLRSTDANLGIYLAGLNTHDWGGLSFQAYDFGVYQADPINSSQSFLYVSAVTGNRNQGADAPIPEPSTGLLVAAGVLAWVGSRRASRRSSPAA